MKLLKSNFLLAVFVLLLYAGQSTAQSKGIQFFKGSWQAALEKAEKEDKPILVDCYTEWCGPCKRLAREVFPQEALGAYVNSHFVAIQMDMEKGPGPDLVKRYGVKSFPTILYLNPKGFKITESIGYWEGDTLIAFAKRAMAKLGVRSLEERFVNGDWSDTVITTYFSELIKGGQFDVAREALATIARKNGNEILYKKYYWNLLPMMNIDSPIAIYAAKNRKALTQQYPADSVNERLRQMYFSINTISGIFPFSIPRGFHKKEYDALKARIITRNIPDSSFLITELDVFVAMNVFEHQKGLSLADSALKNAQPWQYFEMAKLANLIFPDSLLAHAGNWALQAANGFKNEELKAKATELSDSLLKGQRSYSMIPTTEVMGRKLYKL